MDLSAAAPGLPGPKWRRTKARSAPYGRWPSVIGKRDMTCRTRVKSGVLRKNDLKKRCTKEKIVMNKAKPIPVLKLKLSLRDSDPLIWRSIIVPTSTRLHGLHKMI